MKHLFLLTCLLSLVPIAGAQSHPPLEADPIVFRDKVVDSEIGTLFIRVVDVGEPVYQSYRLHVSVLCLDRRSKPNLVKPKLEVLIASRPICGFRPIEYDSRKKILNLQYSKIREGQVGQAQCSSHFEQNILLAEACEVWRK